MLKQLAHVLSAIFHPLLILTLGILVLFNSGGYMELLPYESKRVVVIIIFASTFLLPITFFPFYLYQGIIHSVHMHTKAERRIPYMLTTVIYFLCYLLLFQIGAPHIITHFVLGAAVALAVLVVINFFWKISAHMTALGGLAGGITSLVVLLQVNLQGYFLLAVLISGLVGSARMLLKAHSLLQIAAGWLLGFGAMFFTLML